MTITIKIFQCVRTITKDDGDDDSDGHDDNGYDFRNILSVIMMTSDDDENGDGCLSHGDYDNNSVDTIIITDNMILKITIYS